MVTRATSRIVVPILPLILIGSPVGFSKRSQRNRFPISARFERLPLSPALSESCAVFERRGFFPRRFVFQAAPLNGERRGSNLSSIRFNEHYLSRF